MTPILYFGWRGMIEDEERRAVRPQHKDLPQCLRCKACGEKWVQHRGLCWTCLQARTREGYEYCPFMPWMPHRPFRPRDLVANDELSVVWNGASGTRWVHAQISGR